MKISSSFPSAYMKASDLNGKPINVVMSKVVMEQVGRDKDELPVLYFRGHDKGMVLNKTNTKKIVEAFGDETNEWSGGEIVLFEALVEFQGDTVAALRVRHVPTKQPFAEDRSDAPKQRASDPSVPAPAPGSQAASLLVEAEAMTKQGTGSFRSWRDRLNQDEYELLRQHMARLIEMANKPEAPPMLSETAKKIVRKGKPDIIEDSPF